MCVFSGHTFTQVRHFYRLLYLPFHLLHSGIQQQAFNFYLKFLLQKETGKETNLQRPFSRDTILLPFEWRKACDGFFPLFWIKIKIKKKIIIKKKRSKQFSIFLPIHCPCLWTITFPHLQTLCAANIGHFSPSCEDKFTLSVQTTLKVYKELRLNSELQRSISAFSGKAPIWFHLRWGNGWWFQANIHHRLQNESNVSHMVYFVFRMSENSLEDLLQATISLNCISS